MGTSSQQYCLRWNNHRSNLLTVFDELLRSEAFTDVTLACEGGNSVKCHKMVLAACSSYFQVLFTELPCRHPVVVLKDVKYSEMKAILEYMYRGEVNVAQDQLAALLKVAETLKVKGLVEDRVSMSGTPKEIPESRGEEDHSPPTSGTSQSAIPHSSSNTSPPHSSSSVPYEKPPYNTFGKSPIIDRNNRLPIPMWAVPGLPFPHHTSSIPPPNHHHAAAATLLNSCYEASHSDMSPLKRKKLQSLLMSRDTPILRTVLGQGQADSSQPMSLVCQPDSHDRIHSNGSAQDTEKQSLKADTSLDEARSPYTDISMAEEESPNEKTNKIMMSQSFNSAVSSAIATYVPTQKPEWKRYKQYTRNDIMSAIEAVRNGMSALQAARKYGVPSRTLYDKVKKMGITTSRPFNKRGNNSGTGNPSYFPYNYSGSNSIGGMFGGGDGEEQLSNQPSSLMEPLFLQHALDGMKREIGDHGGMSSSPGENGRSPSPGNFSKYRHNSLTPSPGDEDDEDRVEDLSIARKPEPMRVIMPPMSSLKRDDEEINTGHPEEHRANSLETTADGD